MEKKQRANQAIIATKVMLIDETRKPLGVVNIDQAKLLAYEKDMDLVEVAANANPPVCKILDYGKHIYEKTKQAQKQRSKQKTGETKEIVMGANIDEHDMEVRIKQAKKFLADGHKIKILIRLKGRENIFADRAKDLIIKFGNLAEANLDQPIKRQGSRMFATLKR